MTRAAAEMTRREIADELGIPLADVDKPLDNAAVAAALSRKNKRPVAVVTWRAYVSRAKAERAAGRDRPGLAPAPDGEISGAPYWLPATIARYFRALPGKGARTDLVR